MKRILKPMQISLMIGSLILIYASSCLSGCPPADGYVQKFLPYKAMLLREIDRTWPDLSSKEIIPAQIQKETCPSAKSRMCWSPYAELKTSREYGFGLGQLTITSRFDNFKEAKKLDPSLRSWTWENRYLPEYQVRTLLLMNRFNYSRVAWAQDAHSRMAFTLSAYNGGLGGVLSDRTICANTPGCNPAVWFGNVELTSRKSKVAAKGYGLSFFQVNRQYVAHIMGTFRSRYAPYFKDC